MALKLDMSKAFDRVEWDFVGNMMLSLVFSVSWVNLIIRCILSVSYSFMLNSKVRGSITPSRGLRQGDLVSPYLFIIYAEGLSYLLKKAQRKGNIDGFKCSVKGQAINHFFFMQTIV